MTDLRPAFPGYPPTGACALDRYPANVAILARWYSTKPLRGSASSDQQHERQFSCRCMSLNSSCSTDLASRSRGLPRYETFSINSPSACDLRETEFPCQGSALDIFHIQPGQTFAFCLSYLVSQPETDTWIGCCSTTELCETTKTCCPCCFNSLSRIKIQHASSFSCC
jgi:hypothetical protein